VGRAEPEDRRRERQAEPALNTERTITTGGTGGSSADVPSKPFLVGAVVEPVDRALAEMLHGLAHGAGGPAPPRATGRIHEMTTGIGERP